MTPGEVIISANERIDDLERAGLRLIQCPASFCFSIDAVLLSHFATAHNYDRVMDLCTGTGVIPLLLSTRAKGLRLVGLELNREVAERAARSVRLNKLEASIAIECGDVRNFKSLFPHNSFNVVVANPPYLPVGQGNLSAVDVQRMARHEVTATLRDVVAAAQWLLPTGGRFAMVHRSHRLTDILVVLREHRLEPKRMRMVHAAAGKEANIVLVEAVKDAKPDLVSGPPIFVHNADGTYTAEIRRLYAGGDL